MGHRTTHPPSPSTDRAREGPCSEVRARRSVQKESVPALGVAKSASEVADDAMGRKSMQADTEGWKSEVALARPAIKTTVVEVCAGSRKFEAADSTSPCGSWKAAGFDARDRATAIGLLGTPMDEGPRLLLSSA